MITVKLFGIMRIESGIKELTLDVPNVKELYKAICAQTDRITEKELKKAIDKQIQMEGIEVAIKEKSVEEERSFEDLKADVIKLYSHFVEIEHAELPNINMVVSNQMQGVRLSVAPESYYEKLMVIEAYLLGIE